MARFDKSKARSPKGKTSNRGPRNKARGTPKKESKREFGMTEVTCSKCKKKCEVPFKPTSNKPIYCDKCFAKQNKPSSNKSSDKDLDIINEKLNKIMRALNIK